MTGCEKNVLWMLYLSELVQHAGQFTGIRALSVVLLSPAPSPVAPSPRLLLPLVGGPRSAARRVGGRAKGGRGTGQEGQDARYSLWPPATQDMSKLLEMQCQVATPPPLYFISVFD